MRERHHKRVSVQISATLIIDGQPYSGTIENISVEGTKYSINSLIEKPADFAPRLNLILIFKAPSGASLKLACELIWFSRAVSSDDAPLAMGLRIPDPPEPYRKFVSELIG